MSLSSLALRVCAVKALQGNTMAGARVYDSEIDTLPDLMKEDSGPLIVVSVDEGNDDDRGDLRDLLGVERRLTLLFEVGVAKITPIGAKNANGAGYDVSPQPTSSALEVALDILWRQICRSLLTTAGGVWQDLFWQFALRIEGFERKRGGDAERGIRFASRYYLLHLMPISDPDFGSQPDEDSPWPELIAAMRADADLEATADMVAAEIETPAGIADWRVAQARLGLSEASVRELGITPPYYGDPEDPPTTTSFDFGRGTIDAARADEIAGPADQT